MFRSPARLPSTPAVLQHTWRSHLHRWAAATPITSRFLNLWHINHINELLFVAHVEPAAPPLSASSIVASVMSVLGGVALIVLFLACYKRCVRTSTSSSCFRCVNVYTYTRNVNPAEVSFGKPWRWRQNAVREDDEMESRGNWFGKCAVFICSIFQFHNHSLIQSTGWKNTWMKRVQACKAFLTFLPVFSTLKKAFVCGKSAAGSPTCDVTSADVQKSLLCCSSALMLIDFVHILDKQDALNDQKSH